MSESACCLVKLNIHAIGKGLGLLRPRAFSKIDFKNRSGWETVMLLIRKLMLTVVHNSSSLKIELELLHAMVTPHLYGSKTPKRCVQGLYKEI